MNPQRQPTIDMELGLYRQDLEPETYFPATDISEHFADVPRRNGGQKNIEFLTQDSPISEFSEYSEQLEYLAENLPTYKLFEVYEEALASNNPASVFDSYMARIHDNPSLFEASQGNREGPEEVDFSNPAMGLLYFSYDPDA